MEFDRFGNEMVTVLCPRCKQPYKVCPDYFEGMPDEVADEEVCRDCFRNDMKRDGWIE